MVSVGGGVSQSIDRVCSRLIEASGSVSKCLPGQKHRLASIEPLARSSSVLGRAVGGVWGARNTVPTNKRYFRIILVIGKTIGVMSRGAQPGRRSDVFSRNFVQYHPYFSSNFELALDRYWDKFDPGLHSSPRVLPFFFVLRRHERERERKGKKKKISRNASILIIVNKLWIGFFFL